MTGIDSNVLIRFIVRDDEDQFLKAQELLVQGSSSANPCYVCDVAIAETIWVLTRRYRIPTDTLVDFLRDLLATDNIVVGAQNNSAAHSTSGILPEQAWQTVLSAS